MMNTQPAEQPPEEKTAAADFLAEVYPEPETPPGWTWAALPGRLPGRALVQRVLSLGRSAR